MQTVECAECGEQYSAWRETCPECESSRATASPKLKRPDPYRTLQVDHRADAEVIEAAYKRLAFKYHPDRNAGAKEAKRMQELNDAYALLKASSPGILTNKSWRLALGLVWPDASSLASVGGGAMPTPRCLRSGYDSGP
jgi:preprotein translocase subunit Sec63